MYIPMACLLGANLVLFIMTALRIRKVKNAAASTADSQKHSRLNDDTDRFILYVRLFIVMGITWTAEVVAWAFQSEKDDLKWVFFFTDICNCIQGIIIFFLFVWKPKVKELIFSR
jgi:G protein-coupled receptor Mth (Methuselah protein)